MEIPQVYIIIGVSGSGKSTIAKLLSEKIGAKYLDADDFHSKENVAKMSQGISLTDEDRWPWLSAINENLAQTDTRIVLACSALKEMYRKHLAKGIESKVEWIILEGELDLIASRMRKRDHFMPLELLQSQFDTWEKPDYGIHVNIEQNPENIIDGIINFKMESKSEIGLIGLGVMGQSLSRNIANKGFRLSVYNRQVEDREVDVAHNFVKAYPELSEVLPFDDMLGFVQSLESPRSIFLMVNAGAAVDAVIASLLPHLDEDDIIIDGGNSHYKDTERRCEELLTQHKVHYVGTGVSGGEEGALKGPSIMPGGSPKGYQKIEQIFTTIAAKDYAKSNCCAFIGKGCLLYTSPSPRDATLSRMPSSA